MDSYDRLTRESLPAYVYTLSNLNEKAFVQTFRLISENYVSSNIVDIFLVKAVFTGLFI